MKKKNWCRRCNKAMTKKHTEHGQILLVCEYCGKTKEVRDEQ
jgi:hypothetical protein